MTRKPNTPASSSTSTLSLECASWCPLAVVSVPVVPSSAVPTVKTKHTNEPRNLRPVTHRMAILLLVHLQKREPGGRGAPQDVLRAHAEAGGQFRGSFQENHLVPADRIW